MNPKNKPNLLFIMADGMRHDLLAIAGNRKIQLPNLNKLSEKSAVFKRAYCGQPVSPCSRSTILTGRYPHNNGVLRHKLPLAPEIPTFVELMNDKDYKSAYMGLWVLGSEIDRQHGFDTWVSVEDGYRNTPGEADCGIRQSNYANYLNENGFRQDRIKRGLPLFSRYFCTRLPEQFSKASFLADQAVNFIRENADRPFINTVSFLEPHAPNASVNDDLYDPEEIDLPPAFNLEPSTDIPLRCQLRYRYCREYPAENYPCCTEPLTNEKKWRQHIARYWGKITLVDKQIGRILEELKTNDLEQDTIIVFTSDHGDMMGDFRINAKSVQFESSVRVPLMIHLPGVTTKQILIDKPVSQVDLVPTLLEKLGQDHGEDLDGSSLIPVIEGSSEPTEDVFIEWNGPDGGVKMSAAYYSGEEKEKVDAIVSAPVRTMVTQEGWKLSLSAAGEHELYDLNTDPCETKNLYFKDSSAAQISELRERILNWQKRVNDSVNLI